MTTMSFETDHIESKLDGLALDKQSSNHDVKSYSNIHTPRDNDNMIPATDQRTSSSRNQAGQTQGPHQQLQPQYQPKKSLLSSSLAHERQSSGYGGSIQVPGINVSPGHSHNFTPSPNSKNPSQQAFFSIDEGVDIQRNYSDDHPEPELLASSVGKEIDGRIVPSSSTISLLSLNNHNHGNPHFVKVNETSPTVNSVSGFQPSYLPSPKADQSQQQQPQQHHPQPTAFYQASHPLQSQSHAVIDRKNSYNNIASRNSITHLNQIRLQPYHKFSSPSPVIQQQQNSAFGQQQQQPTTEFITFQSTPSQGIPINTRNDGTLIVPDSPNLDPTSLGGSPSRFWLSSQTPPRSLAGSLSRNSRTQLAQMFHQHQYHLQNQHIQNQNHQYPTSVHHSNSPQAIHGTTTITRNISAQFNKADPPHNISVATTDKLQQTGGSSPILNPVQTPSEDPPMTPLYLNAHGHVSGHCAKFEQTGYFDGLNIDTVLSKDEVEKEGDESDDEIENDNGIQEDTNKSGDVIMN